MKKSVILHIGLPKTGTSAIQSFLASNVEQLERDGVRYPKHTSFDRAQQGRITSGNCSNKADDIFHKISEEVVRCPDETRFLFSNEHMFIQRESICRIISSLRKNIDFEVIFFVRNPLDMAMSAYQQSVKRGGETRGFEECAMNFDFLLEAHMWHQELSDLGVRVSVLNYSKTKKDTIRRFLELLNCKNMLSNEDYANASKRVVNRSLSPMELSIVRSANENFGAKVGQALSDRLVETSPNVRSQRAWASDRLMDIFQERFGSAVEYFNHILPAGEGLEIVKPKSETSESRDSEWHDEEFASIAAAFNSAMTQRDPEEVRLLEMERNALLRDVKARKSRLAQKIDFWDYQIHAFLSKIHVFGNDFSERFRVAAERRHRRCYDE